MNKLLVEGITDAFGFVGGALLGFWVGRLLGFDIFAEGYGGTAIMGILLVGGGAGVGVQVGRRLRAAARKQSD